MKSPSLIRSCVYLVFIPDKPGNKNIQYYFIPGKVKQSMNVFVKIPKDHKHECKNKSLQQRKVSWNGVSYFINRKIWFSNQDCRTNPSFLLTDILKHNSDPEVFRYISNPSFREHYFGCKNKNSPLLKITSEFIT